MEKTSCTLITFLLALGERLLEEVSDNEVGRVSSFLPAMIGATARGKTLIIKLYNKLTLCYILLHSRVTVKKVKIMVACLAALFIRLTVW